MKKLVSAIFVPAILGLVCSCNSDDSGEIKLENSNARVMAFSLSQDLNVLPGLDSVYFSINQHTLEIFNADSLPKGTSLEKIVPVITTSAASIVELHVPRPGQSDSIYNYLENNTDTINFANGPVKLRVVSLDGVTTSVYVIRINVHESVPDTMIWSRLERASLPSRFQVVSEQHTVQMGDQYVCLTRYEQNYCMARTADPAGRWEYITPDFQFLPDLNTFSATDDHAYILDSTKRLWTSTDLINWTYTGEHWTHIYGNFENTIYGCQFTNGQHYMVTYPATTQREIADNFPISGTSLPIQYTPYMGTGSLMIIVGGRTAGMQVSNAAWAFDGETWIEVSHKPLPYAVENLTVVPYFVVKTAKNSWRTTKTSVLLGMCGTRADGTLNDSVFVSRDFGMNWEMADSTMQFPATIPARTYAQAFTHSSVLNVPAPAGVRTLKFCPLELPWDAAVSTHASRATEPITEWDCPYIYLFGGQNTEGVTYNTLWRGVINRFTFKPLQ